MTVRSLEPFQYALHAHVRSGSVSRRGHNQDDQRQSQLTGGATSEEASPPNASCSSGEGVRGRGASLREAASPPESCLSLPRTSAAALLAAVDITKMIRDNPTSQAEPPPKKHPRQTPAALRERGSGGEALLSEKRPLSLNLAHFCLARPRRLCQPPWT